MLHIPAGMQFDTSFKTDKKKSSYAWIIFTNNIVVVFGVKGKKKRVHYSTACYCLFPPSLPLPRSFRTLFIAGFISRTGQRRRKHITEIYPSTLYSYVTIVLCYSHSHLLLFDRYTVRILYYCVNYQNILAKLQCDQNYASRGFRCKHFSWQRCRLRMMQ